MSHVGARRRAPAWSGPARSARPALFPTWRNADPAGLPADAHRDPALPPPGAGAAGRRGGRATTQTLREFLERRPLLGVLHPALHGAAGRGGVVVRPGPSRWTTPRATSSRSSTTTACSASSARPQWRTVTGGSREYVDAVAAGLDDVRTGHQGHLGARDRRRASRSPTATARSTTYDAVVVATHPGQALAMLAEPTAGPARGARRDAVLPQHRAAAHRRPGCCPGRRARGRRGTTGAADGRRGPRHRHLRPHPPAAARRPDTPLPRHPRRRGPRRPGDGDRHDGVRAPALHPGVRGGPAAAAELDTDRIAFAGAYHGWGFHEDGARSGVVAARAPRPGVADRRSGRRRRRTSRAATGCTRRRSGTPAGRRSGARFAHRSRTWLVDLDDLPDHGAARRPVRGPRPPRRPGRAILRRTSTPSSPPTAST